MANWRGDWSSNFCEHSSEAWFFQRWNREPVVVVVVVVVVVACLRNLKFFESSQSLRSESFEIVTHWDNTQEYSYFANLSPRSLGIEVAVFVLGAEVYH